MTKYNIDADFFQFHLKDEQTPAGALAEAWNEQALETGFAVAPGIIGVGTERNTSVTVSVEVIDTAPANDCKKWDRINEGNLDLPSGCLTITSPTWENPVHLPLPSGVYHTRVYYGNLRKPGEQHTRRKDHYKAVLWMVRE